MVQALRCGTAKAPSVHLHAHMLCLCTQCYATALCTALQQVKHAPTSWRFVNNTVLHHLPPGRHFGQCPESSLTVKMFSWYTCSTAMGCVSKST